MQKFSNRSIIFSIVSTSLLGRRRERKTGTFSACFCKLVDTFPLSYSFSLLNFRIT